jgi:hypothetical protein
MAKIFCSVITFFVEMFRDLTFCVEKFRDILLGATLLLSTCTTKTILYTQHNLPVGRGGERKN